MIEKTTNLILCSNSLFFAIKIFFIFNTVIIIPKQNCKKSSLINLIYQNLLYTICMSPIRMDLSQTYQSPDIVVNMTKT